MTTNHNDDPAISVIIPTYNEEKRIEKTLISVRNQKCEIPYETIVVDGQSLDNTVKISEQYAKTYISPKKGKVNQLNYVTPKTKGNLILFLDADTLISPDFLSYIHELFIKDDDLFACSARFKYYDGIALNFSLGSKNFTLTNYFFQNSFVHTWYFFKTLYGYPELSGSNIVVRRKIYQKVGGFKEPPNSLGIDKVFSDSILFLTKKMNKGKIKTLNFISVLTSGRHLTVERSIKRLNQYNNQKEIYSNLAMKLHDI
ncbi:MAG: glycosyltransferase [Candidatus Lokiarchaeota archaeon]|nr:glycosyltransferase [Candidatus Lokiarchaeota archaeon]MBD3201743.1 glycosyltransferase [Candidatus Lokiarchaeota archaeon]